MGFDPAPIGKVRKASKSARIESTELAGKLGQTIRTDGNNKSLQLKTGYAQPDAEILAFRRTC